MRTKKWCAVGLALLFFMTAAQVHTSGGHGHQAARKVGILLVAFGSSEASAQVSFENINRKIKATRPDTSVRWAYTSDIIRNKLARQGKEPDSPAVALAKMLDEKFTHVAVLSLHTTGGAEKN